MVGSLVVLTGDDGTRLSTTSPAGTGRAGGLAPGRRRPAPPGARRPRVRADPGGRATRPGCPFPDLGPLLVYGAPGDGLLGLGPGGVRPAGPGGRGRTGSATGPRCRRSTSPGGRDASSPRATVTVSLGWPRADGSLVHVLAVGMSDDDLLAGGPGDRDTRSPPAMPLPADHARRHRAADGRLPPTRSRRGTPRSTTNRAAARSGSASSAAASTASTTSCSTGWPRAPAGGRPPSPAPRPSSAPTRRSGDRAGVVSLIWAVDDGVVAELTAHGLSDAEIEAAAASIHQVDEAAWNEVRSHGPTPSRPSRCRARPRSTPSTSP